jgi:hypothetical protein
MCGRAIRRPCAQARAFQMGLKASPRDKMMQQGFWDALTMMRQEQPPAPPALASGAGAGAGVGGRPEGGGGGPSHGPHNSGGLLWGGGRDAAVELLSLEEIEK